MDTITVRTAGETHREAALELLFLGLPPHERAAQVREVVENHKRGEISLDGLLVAERGGTAVGSIFASLQSDGTAFVWPPSVAIEEDAEAVADSLLQGLCRHIDAAGAWLGQCLIETQRAFDRDRLTRRGFLYATDLHYLQRPLDEPLPQRRADLQWISYEAERNREIFARVLEQTYENSLDCQALRGVRTGLESLESHEASPQKQFDQWRVLRADGREAGVILCNDHPDLNSREIAYLGVVPAARGRGHGRAMAIAALHDAREAGRESMLVAVDAENSFARELYRDLGFHEAAVRAVHLRVAPK